MGWRWGNVKRPYLLPVVVIVMSTVGWVFLGIGVADKVRYADAQTAPGRVVAVGVDSKGLGRPQIEWRDKDGTSWQFWSTVSTKPVPQVGDQVTVEYLPDGPSTARQVTTFTWLPIVLGATGPIFAGVGVGLLRSALRRDRTAAEDASRTTPPVWLLPQDTPTQTPQDSTRDQR